MFLTILPDARLLGPRLIAQARTAATAAERKAGRVKVTPDLRGFRPQLLQGMRQPLKQAGREGQSAFKWLAAGTVAVGINKAVQAASNLNETITKTRVVFGPASKLVEDFGRGAAESIGMSSQAAIESAATLGNLFVSMKIGQGDAAKMSTTMVQLAGDMASFNNTSPEETLTAIRAGLVGETEPLRRFGINLNEATLKAEAMRLGLGKIGPTLTPLQRTQAAYSLILQQSKTAQGDFARTSDGLANRQRILAAQYKDAQAALGKGLLPVMSTAVAAASSLASGFADLDASTGGASTKILLAGVAIAGLGYAVGKTVIFVRSIQTAWAAYRATQITATAASEVAAASQVRLAAATSVSGASATAAAGGIGGLRGALLGLSAAASAAFVVVGVGREQLKGLRGDTTAAGDPVTWLAKQLGLWHGKAKEAAAGTKEASAAAAAGKQTTDLYGEALKAVGGGAAGASPKLAALTDKLKTQKAAFAETKQATAEQIESYKGLVSQSKITAGQVVKDLRNQTANFRTYSKDVHRLIAAGVNPTAIRELSQKGPEYIHALATGSNRELGAYKKYWRDRQAEVKGSFAKSMEAQYQDLVRKMRAMQREINKLKGKTVSVSAHAQVEIDPNTRRGLLALGIKGYGTKFFAKGGRITEGSGPTADDVLIRASKRETVVSARDSDDPWFKAWARERRIPGFQRGGLVGGFLNPAVNADRRYGQMAAERLADKTGAALGKEIGKVAGGMLGGLTGPGGWRWQIGVLRAAFPGLALISGYRTRYFTATGGHSYHNMGRAVDVPPRMDVFNWIRGHYGARTKELIFTPAGGRQIHNGQPHVYTGVTARDHWNHVHWAYRTGAWKVLADQIAKVHRGEMIVPAQPAENFRQAVAGGLGGGLPPDFYERLAAAIAANPPRVYLDRQRVSHELRSGGLWDARRD